MVASYFSKIFICRCLTLCMVIVMQACAFNDSVLVEDLPDLRLLPAQLGRVLSVRQKIDIRMRGGQQHTVEVLLEVDAQCLKLAVVSLGQIAGRLVWDGHEILQTLAIWTPSEISPSRVLAELQLTLWPVDAIRLALPSSWSLHEDAGVRTLLHRDQPIIKVTLIGADQWLLENMTHDYQLKIKTLSEDSSS